MAGSILAGIWHVGLALTYAYAATTERMAILSPGEPLDVAITNRGYIPFVYMGLMLLICIHARTLVLLGPPPR